MFKEMRRTDRALDSMEQERLLTESLYGVLSMTNSSGYAYGVPLSYAYKKPYIYIHSATTGQKLDAIEHNACVSFCVVDDVETLPDKFSTTFKSVVAFGKATLVTDTADKEYGLLALVEKYSPDFLEKGKIYIANAKDKTTVIKIEIESMTGKGRLEK